MANAMASAMAYRMTARMPHTQNPYPELKSHVHRWLLVVQDFDLRHQLANAREMNGLKGEGT